MTRITLASAVIILCSIATVHGGEKAWFGFAVRVETAGFPLNPTVRSVLIGKVAPNSPASAQHIEVGDEIMEAEGHAVPGGRALQLRPLLMRQVGDVLHLRLKRANGELYPAVLTGIAKPAP